MDVPAFCDTCGTVFRFGTVAEDSTSIVAAGGLAGPCPVCGGTGHVPDELVDFVQNTIEILSVPRRTIGELSRLAQVLYDSREAKQSPEQVADAIRQEVPEFAKLADVLPKAQSELSGFVGLIAGVISLLTQASLDGDDTIDVTVQQTINLVLVETDNALMAKQKAHMQQATRKVGRNNPCPCGSGKRYKRCCGRIQ